MSSLTNGKYKNILWKHRRNRDFTPLCRLQRKLASESNRKKQKLFFWFMPNSQLVARQRKEVTHPSLWYGHTARLLNTILNSSFTIDIQSGLPDDCLKSSLQLPDYCLMTAWLVPDECLVVTEDCLMTAWQLPDNCLTAWRLSDSDNCLMTDCWPPDTWFMTELYQLKVFYFSKWLL